MGDEAVDRYTLNIDCRQSKHRHSHCPHAQRVFSKDFWSNELKCVVKMILPSVR